MRVVLPLMNSLVFNLIFLSTLTVFIYRGFWKLAHDPTDFSLRLKKTGGNKNYVYKDLPATECSLMSHLLHYNYFIIYVSIFSKMSCRSCTLVKNSYTRSLQIAQPGAQYKIFRLLEDVKIVKIQNSDTTNFSTRRTG